MTDALMTLDELAAFLDPQMPGDRLKLLAGALGIEPAGRRLTGGPESSHLLLPGNPDDEVHAAVTPFCAGRWSNC
jgi:hypothetical protein